METPLLEWLILCLRSNWDPKALSAARAQAGRLDHVALVQCAQAEGVAPLLYTLVRGRGILPPSFEESLRLAYLSNAARNFFLLRELEKVLHTLSDQGISVLLLKGAALGPAVYGNPALRPMGDLDLLVRPADAPRALETLFSIGYRPIRPPLHPTTLTTDETQIFLRHGEVNLELHWGLLDFPLYAHHLPMETIWADAHPISIGTAQGWMLDAKDQILHLCAHLVLHHGEGRPRLLWLCDIAEVIVHAGEKLNWTMLLKRARSYNLLLPLQQVLPRLANEWQVPIPPAVLERLREAQPSSKESRLYLCLAAQRHSVARRFWENLAGRPTWSERLRFAWDNLFPSPAYMRERYAIRHPLLLPFYYPYRWLLGLRSALSPKP